MNIDSSQPILINDNNDGIPTAGEEFGISVPIINFGSQIVQSITATLTSYSNLINILNDQIFIGDISVNQSLYLDDFNVSLDPSAVQSEDLELYISFQDNENNQWTSKINLDIRGSHLIPNEEIIIQPGQTNSFSISLVNQGSLQASNVVGEIITSSNLITINNSSDSWGTINAGSEESSGNGFNVTASSDVVSGSQLIASLLIEDSNGYSRTENIVFRFGTVQVDDPLGPDNYGYYIYDSNDINYNLHP